MRQAADPSDDVPSVLVLTDLTRRGGEDRRVVVQGVDLPLRNVIIAIAGFVIGAPIGLIAVAVASPMRSLIDPLYVWATAVAVVELLCYVAVVYRVRSGVGVFQSQRDRHRAGNGRVWLGTEQVPPLDRATFELCVRGALPLHRHRQPPDELGLS
ncbi:MAG: hypothetical protein ACRD0G_13755 [Acidimicrobiales bacterium]